MACVLPTKRAGLPSDQSMLKRMKLIRPGICGDFNVTGDLWEFVRICGDLWGFVGMFEHNRLHSTKHTEHSNITGYIQQNKGKFEDKRLHSTTQREIRT
jgi:hypothetical protein